MPSSDCTRCGNKLTKPRLAAGKRKCYRCERAVRREQKQKAHDRNVQSEDFTAADYWRIYQAQGGTCAVRSCRAKGLARHLAVEHDHACAMGHDPARWCRACVRGLVCSTHNEWIGRAGDNPEVFDSLAEFLRNPPARETIMASMVAGTEVEILGILRGKYKVPPKRARTMLDMARSVGPSPAPVAGATITVRYIRIPRTDTVLYSIDETSPRIESHIALEELTVNYGLSEKRAKSVLNLAWKRGTHKVATPAGAVLIHYHGRNDEAYIFSIEESA